MNLTSKSNLPFLNRTSIEPKFKFYFSFRYPLVAHELLCHSSMLAEALVEGGWYAEQPEDLEDEDDDDDDLSNDIDDDDVDEREDTDTDEE